MINSMMSCRARTQKQPVTLFLQDFGGALLQDGQVCQDCHHLGFKREIFDTKSWIENADFLHRITSPSLDLKTCPPTGLCFCLPHLVFGVGRVHPLAVPAGLKQDLDGVELQQDLAGHAVEEGDVGQGRRRQQEHLAAGGALAQLCRRRIQRCGPGLGAV